MSSPATRSVGAPRRSKDRAGASAGCVLVIDDSPDLGRLIRKTLKKARYRAIHAKDGETGLKLARSLRPDLIVLDIGLPGMDGFAVLSAIRAMGRIPVIVLTGSTAEADCVVGLKLGADDFLIKPVSMQVLAARVEAILRRVPSRAPDPGSRERRGSLRLDSRSHELIVHGKALLLAPKEFHILRLLLEAHGRVVNRRELLLEVWGYDKDLGMDTRMVDQYMSRIRRKLKSEGRRIVTVPTLGYKIRL
ncbi:MAG: response regulator transcription factor [Elusimicrobia bacterium]|nr:response regulator transcription factor [Elusimicrobiota bacterium]